MNNFEDFKYVKGFGGKGSQAAPSPTPAYEDVEGFVYNGDNYNVYQFAKVKDLISEGPIQGLAEGQYLYKGRVGDLGFTGVYYNEYPTVSAISSRAKYLRSVQWNGNPLLDSQDKYNFQQIDINITKGEPQGTSSNGEFDNVSYIRSIGERLRGPNELATTAEEVTDYQRSYRIINKECKKIALSFRVSSLYQTLKYQDLKVVSDNTKYIDGVLYANTNTQTFTLSTYGRDNATSNLENKDILAGVGSVIYNKFTLRIKLTPVYKEGYNSNLPEINIVSSRPNLIRDDKNQIIKVANKQDLFETVFFGKVTQGYVKQIILDTSANFTELNSNENWLGWDITLLKITPEDTFSTRASFLSLESITEIYSSSFRYPNSSIITSKFNAAYFSKIPDRTYDVNLLKVNVPANYDPITKTYGNTSPLTIDTKEQFYQTKKTSPLFYFGEGNSYINSDNDNPPVTDGLIGQFDANKAVAPAGTLTSWPNSIASSNIKCILGSAGTYASPNPVSNTNVPKKGNSYSELSSSSFSYGVTFLATEKVSFRSQETQTEFFSSDKSASGGCTIFIVCKWHNSATNTQRNRILQGFGNDWSLGFYKKFNAVCKFGDNWVFGNYGPDTNPDNSHRNASNYYNSTNDGNTYIVGSSISQSKDVNVFWHNSVYSTKTTKNSEAPKGLGINIGAVSAETSYCTVFEVLIYNKVLTNSDALKVRNWLNKKWNVNTVSCNTFSSSVKLFNDYSLDVGASTYITVPLKTTCKIAQYSKGYSNEYQNAITYNENAFSADLIQKYKVTFSANEASINTYLKDEAFCSFYCDFYLKLKNTISDGTYSLINRSNQFNLSIKISGQSTSLILKIISPNDGKVYTINKDLTPDASASNEYSTTNLKKNFTRFTVNILPKCVVPQLSFVPGGIEISENTISAFRANEIYQKYPNLVAKQGNTTDGFVSLISDIRFKEDTSYENLIRDRYNFITAFAVKAYAGNDQRLMATDYLPNIINSQIEVLVDSQAQIRCKINIADYDAYQTLKAGHDSRPMYYPSYNTLFASNNLSYYPNQDGINEGLYFNSNIQIGAYGHNVYRIYNLMFLYGKYTWAYQPSYPTLDKALEIFNNQNTDANFYGKTEVSLNTSQLEVLLPVKGDQIFMAEKSAGKWTNFRTGKFLPSDFINSKSDIEIFNSNSFGSKIEGYADSIKVNEILFDRVSLSSAFAGTIITESLPKKTTIYAPQGVASYENSTDYWDGNFKANKEWTDNPAWCFYDLLTNKRYGVGNYISNTDVDKWSLYQIGKYCDQLVADGFGGVEPRFTCNLYIQSQEDALKVLSDMASIFRGMFYYSNGFIYAINDMPEDTPVYSFNNSNVIDGNFNYESTSLKDRNSAVYIRYIDKNNLYKPAVEYIENIEAVRKFGFKETELTAFGCTSRGQAQRLGRWLLASEYNETETVSFEAGPESVYLKPGDVIKIHDYNKKYKTVGGRLNLINISGDTNATTGTLTLDRKLDFDFSNNKNYKLTILSPKYNLDPSFNGAISNSDDYKDYRKPLTNSFIINSSNLIAGQYYDSIRVTGLTPVMASGLNITGLAYFTGASGMSPKAITWFMENSGNLNGSTDSDYDFYRIFRIQESTEGTNYTVLASQMYNLKYVQIESGLNITPPKPAASPASAPSKVLFTESENKIYIGINYDSSIKDNTIGFKIFIKPSYDLSFNANSDTDCTFVSIDIYESRIDTSITNPKNGGTMRVYGVNVNNESSVSFVEGQNTKDTTITSVNYRGEITYEAVNLNSKITINSQGYNFYDTISQSRNNYFPISNATSPSSSNGLSITIPLQFLSNPNKYINSEYPYRIIVIPEKVSNKKSFTTLYNKYYQNASNLIFADTIDKNDVNSYLFSSNKTFGKYRDFSIAIDKFSNSVGIPITSTSNDFVNENGFLLLTYDNQDQSLTDSLNTIIKDTRNSFSITTSDGSNKLNFVINQDTLDPFINKFYLLLTPIDQKFQFGINTINYFDPNSPISINDSNGNEIKDSHFITIKNINSRFNFNSVIDDIGRQFNSTSYNAYLIASDVFMSTWASYADVGTTRNILDYYSSFIDKDNSIGKIYPKISDPIVIKKAEDVTTPLSLEQILKDAGSRYLHFTLNKTTMIENIFDSSLVATSVFPNYTLSRRSVVYKPTLDTNLTTQDNNVVSTNPNGTMAYYKLSLQNRDNISRSPISPVIPQSTRAYVLNGNKIFTRALIQNTDITANPTLIQGVNSETVNSNIYKLKNTITDSSFGKNGQELFDISIIRLSDLSGDLKSEITDYSPSYSSISVNSSTSSTEATSNTIFNSLISNGFFNSSLNVVNVTPENNWSEIGVSPKNIICGLGNTPKQMKVYSLNGDIISNQFSLPSINSLYYAGVPVLEENDVLLTLNIGNATQTRPIKVYCFNGEELIESITDKTKIETGPNNTVNIFMLGLKFKNYYTYANSYNATTSITNSNFWSFKDPKNLAFAHLSAKNALGGTIPKYNFHIQALELSVVVTY